MRITPELDFVNYSEYEFENEELLNEILIGMFGKEGTVREETDKLALMHAFVNPFADKPAVFEFDADGCEFQAFISVNDFNRLKPIARRK